METSEAAQEQSFVTPAPDKFKVGPTSHKFRDGFRGVRQIFHKTVLSQAMGGGAQGSQAPNTRMRSTQDQFHFQISVLLLLL